MQSWRVLRHEPFAAGIDYSRDTVGRIAVLVMLGYRAVLCDKTWFVKQD